MCHFLQLYFTGYVEIRYDEGNMSFRKKVYFMCIFNKRFRNQHSADIFKDVVFDFRQNDKSEWKSIGRSKKSMSYIVQNIPGEDIIKKVEMYRYECEISSYRCSASIAVDFKYDECLSYSKMPTFRCRILNRNETLDISRVLRLPLKGEKIK